MSDFNRFKTRTQIEQGLASKANKKFIENSKSSTEVLHVRLGTTIKAVITTTQKEGVDDILLFTYPFDTENDKLIVGDYIEHENKQFLIFMNYYHPLINDYEKYKLIECNVTINYDDTSIRAAYFSNMQSFNAATSQTKEYITLTSEKQKPVVVVTANTDLKVGKRIAIAGDIFKIVSLDRHSNSGVYYLSIEQAVYNESTYEKDLGTAITVRPPEKDVVANSITKGGEITVTTNSGYVLFDTKVKIINRTYTSVTFKVPYDVSSLTVTTKDESDNFIYTTYEVI